MSNPKRIAIITCYKAPDYVRASTLRVATQLAFPDAKIIVIKNKHTGLMRYAEVFGKVLYIRIRRRPTHYLLTFRGYEMLLPLRLLTIGRPLVYDEFINVEEWLIENNKIKLGSTAQKIINYLYSLLINHASDHLITDTQSHAEYSISLTGMDESRVTAVPLATDEDIFSPRPLRRKNKHLEVFYYGSMLPLHGLDYVLSAAEKLKDHKILFKIVGGNDNTARVIKALQAKGVSIDYKRRVPYEEIASLASSADVCLGGPFGGTLQSKFVITGKTYQFLAMGKATIVGRNLETGKAGFSDKVNTIVVEQASAHDLVKALLWCDRNKKKLDSIGRAGADLYGNNLSLQKTAQVLKEKVFLQY